MNKDSSELVIRNKDCESLVIGRSGVIVNLKNLFLKVIYKSRFIN